MSQSTSPKVYNGLGEEGQAMSHENKSALTDKDVNELKILNDVSPRRKRRKTSSIGFTDSNAAVAVVAAVQSPSTETKEKMTKRKQQQKDREDMSWVCAECKEAECGLVTQDVSKGGDLQDDANKDDDLASHFLICDGPCQRIFHVPCASLSRVPSKSEDWFCKDCLRKEHSCSYCSEYGKDNIDVFACQNDLCGLFFHESCLQTHHVDYTYKKTSDPSDTLLSVVTLSTNSSPSSTVQDEKNDTENFDYDEEEKTGIPFFTCPAHDCWTCTQKDMIRLEKDEEAQEKRQQPKKKQKKKKPSIFHSKPGRLHQCLYCPIAYHATCIPPTARFHELAVLCHEHSMTHKLPELDIDSSIQSKVEEKVDQTLMRLHGINRSRSKGRKAFSFGRGHSANPFFPALRGDRYDSVEQELLKSMKDASAMDHDMQQSDSTFSEISINPSSAVSMVLDGNLPFCLPVDLKSEVYSKPPPYSHIQGNKFDADKNNRPKKIPAATRDDKEQCTCSGKVCGDDCFNRVIMSECIGPTNCSLGDKDCGNRSLGKRNFVKCQPKRERGKGWGLVTLESVPKGKLVQEYLGEVIDEKEKERRLSLWNQEHPNDPNFYVMALSGGYYVDAREYANLSRFINHSCAPNCKVVSVNVKGNIRNGIYSIRDIQSGEFLSYDYHFDTKQGDRFVCRCGAPNCRGTMKGMGREDGPTKPSTWKEAKARYEADKKFLQELKGAEVASLVDALLPCAEHPNETIASGPLEKHRREVIAGRIFLWRNLRLGADFFSRQARRTRKKSSARNCFMDHQ